MARLKSIKKMSQRPKKVNLFLYGEPGTGKTPLIATSPRALILNADGRDAIESARPFQKNFHIVEVQGQGDLDDVFQYLRHEDHPYKWCWLDGSTLFQELHMDEILEGVVAVYKHRDLHVPSPAEYQKEQREFSKWVRHMSKLPINFGMTAHQMVVEYEEGDSVLMPMIQGGQGQLSSKLCGYFSVVGRLYIAKKEKGGKTREVQMLQTKRTAKAYARDRFRALGSKMVNPTIPEIMRLTIGTKE